MRRIHVTPCRHIIRIELSRVGSTAAIWGFRQAVYRGIVRMEGIGADSDARRRRDRTSRPRPHPGLVTQGAKDQPDGGLPGERVLPTRQAETRMQMISHCILDRVQPKYQHQRRSGRTMLVRTDDGAAPHYVTARRAIWTLDKIHQSRHRDTGDHRRWAE